MPEAPPVLNAQADSEMLERIAPLESDAEKLLQTAAEKMKLSARGYFRVRRLARTIADLGGGETQIRRPHIAEALSYRRLRMQ
jgi:magnesium chelatase family protein